VKAYVKRGKNDAADAEALCEAVTRPSMRFVPVKSKEQQAACMLMTVRERLVSVKSQLSNAFRSYAAEFGIVGPAGRQNVTALIKRVLRMTACRKWRGISSASRRRGMPQSKLAWQRSRPS
jgi:transposase